MFICLFNSNYVHITSHELCLFICLIQTMSNATLVCVIPKVIVHLLCAPTNNNNKNIKYDKNMIYMYVYVTMYYRIANNHFPGTYSHTWVFPSVRDIFSVTFIPGFVMLMD